MLAVLYGGDAGSISYVTGDKIDFGRLLAQQRRGPPRDIKV